MSLEELLYLADTYKRLASPFNHFFSYEGYEIYNDAAFDHSLFKLVRVLKILNERFDIGSLTQDMAWNFLNCVKDAQKMLTHLVECGPDVEDYDDNELEKAGRFLKKAFSDLSFSFRKGKWRQISYICKISNERESRSSSDNQQWIFRNDFCKP